jgi:hypothetical protein
MAAGRHQTDGHLQTLERSTIVLGSRPKSASPAAGGAWQIAAQGGAALAAAVGVGRFVYTPLLPLMQTQAGVAAATGGQVATANYLGYLLGALAGVLAPQVGRSRGAFRISGSVLVLTLAAMPLTHAGWLWAGLRGVAGAASAVMFLVAVNTVLAALPAQQRHLAGWAYGGVGAGIAASGLLVLAVRTVGDWRTGWWAAAALTALLVLAGRSVGTGTGTAGQIGRRTAAGGADGPRGKVRTHGVLLAGSYTLEGAGYILAGTFLVAAVAGTGPAWLSEGVWVLVGLAALPSCALWAALSRRVSRPTLLTAALALQTIAIALPAVTGGPGAALIAAVLFGATFMGITTLALAAGAHLEIPRAAATLSLGYAAGQVLGPLTVQTLLTGGYTGALLVGAALAAAAGVGSALLRLRFPHGMEAHRGHRRPRHPAPSAVGVPGPGAAESLVLEGALR